MTDADKTATIAPESPQQPDPTLAVQTFGLSRIFGNLVAVDSINLGIKKGELFALLGPNGAGKTTTISMLCCLLKPTGGTASVMGHDITREPVSWRGNPRTERSRVGGAVRGHDLPGIG